MSFITIKVRRGTTAQWDSSTKNLASGEIGFDTTLNKIKIGNGSTSWASLPYLNSLPSELNELVQDIMGSTLVAGTGISKSYDDASNLLTISIDTTIANKDYVNAAIDALGSTASETYVPVSLIGNPDGVASLDSNGKIPDSEIPSTIARDSEVAFAISNAISNLIDSAPGALDTLNELAAAINDDASYAATITTALSGKVDSNYVTIGNTLLEGISGQSYGLIGTSAYLDVKNTNGYNKEIELDIAALETKLDTDGYIKQAAIDNKVSLSDPSIDYYVTNSGSGGYLVNGVLNGTINFTKGKKYRIVVNATGHPFWIQTVSGAYSAGNLYSTGITNAGIDNGSIIVELPQSAPDNLYYVCQYHSSMRGSINSYSVDVVEYAPSSGLTSYTLSSANSSKMTEFTAATDVTITIPSDPSNITWPIGSGCELRQMGTGRLIFFATSPATIVSTDGYLKTRTQYSSVFLEKRASNAWILTGDIDA